MLLTIIAVAAFNVVSALVMVVTDKQGDIAILRTLGASPAKVMAIFMVQGSMIGVIGTATGVVLGVLATLSLPALVAALEQLLNYQFLNSDVYPVNYLPVDLRLQDVALVAGTALVMSLIATLYPAWRAAKVLPAIALRHE
jgi:lipoprotein-releasing system permease protein